MHVPIYQIDAFTSTPFAGNPAAVCPLNDWLPDAVMLAIAAENNLSETAFFIRRDGDFHLRWFTPALEVDLCGHATLASAFVVLTELEVHRDSVVFQSRSGPLSVARKGDTLVMDFPTLPARPVVAPPELTEALGAAPTAVLAARDLMAVFDDAETVRRLCPDMKRIARLPAPAVIVTAPGTGADGDVDFVSRFFAPAAGIPEDPVTGSAHCSLAPYWSARLGRPRLSARQVSARGGMISCFMRGARVDIAGQAVLVLRGTLSLP